MGARRDGLGRHSGGRGDHGGATGGPHVYSAVPGACSAVPGACSAIVQFDDEPAFERSRRARVYSDQDQRRWARWRMGQGLPVRAAGRTTMATRKRCLRVAEESSPRGDFCQPRAVMRSGDPQRPHGSCPPSRGKTIWPRRSFKPQASMTRLTSPEGQRRLNDRDRCRRSSWARPGAPPVASGC
jgi:hypothetical protein